MFFLVFLHQQCVVIPDFVRHHGDVILHLLNKILCTLINLFIIY